LLRGLQSEKKHFWDAAITKRRGNEGDIPTAADGLGPVGWLENTGQKGGSLSGGEAMEIKLKWQG